jgi:hypothetical protein
MKNLKTIITLLTATMFVVGICGSAYGGSAAVLPKGVSRVSVNHRVFNPIEDRFDPDGKREGVDADYNRVLDDTVFPLPIPGSNIGTSIVDFQYERNETYIGYQYGLSDKVTLGLYIPYFDLKTDFDEARVDSTGATQATLDLLPIPACTAGTPTCDAIITQFVLNFLQSPPYNYEPLDTWSDTGIGDLQIGARYQYRNDDRWRLALTGSVQLPTGEVDDPDNLIDLRFGWGTTVIHLASNNDLLVSDALTLNFTLEYDWFLSDKEKLRVPVDVNNPITESVNTEKVDRDLSDNVVLETSGSYDLGKGFSASLLYRYIFTNKTSVSGDRGLAYESLEEETKEILQTYIVGLSYSTVPAFREKGTGIPMDVSLTYRDRFSGENVTDSSYINLGLNVYF